MSIFTLLLNPIHLSSNIGNSFLVPCLSSSLTPFITLAAMSTVKLMAEKAKG
uniref:Uncharacterized protein n=1 Tax=Nelumbo nucifera TaxID=4432 RepID=A0A822XH63_NELNU|nr:TPA_asm: hypothetical protein HUJ06_020755 [Nelumbo nucifera]